MIYLFIFKVRLVEMCVADVQMYIITYNSSLSNDMNDQH